MLRLRPQRAFAAALVFLLTSSNCLAQEPPPATQTPQPVFEFHSSFWMNLHHFLYQQARLRQLTLSSSRGPVGRVEGSTTQPNSTWEPAGQSTGRGAKPSAGGPETGALTPEEHKAWTTALDYYAGDLAGRDLLFNGDMVNIKNRLAELESCTELSGRSSPRCASGLRPEMVTVLERAAPVYRARWWPAHDRSNRAWVASVGPMVRKLGGELAQQLSETYHAEWPAGQLRVDVVFYGGPFGAYTTLDPVRLTVSSSDPRNQDSAALEVLFHEASHALAGAVRDAIVSECRMRGKPIPRDLWHALLFYTTGEMVKRALIAPGSAAAHGPGSYTPYAYRYGLYARGWSAYQRVLERYWQPYLDGKVEFNTAVARLVSAL